MASLSRFRFQITAAAIVVLALALRVAAARGNLWQDEITSLDVVSVAHSFAGIFLIAYDNNHYLNTAYLYLVGPNASPLVMRAFSILLGTATVAAAGLVFLPKDRGAALLAMGLFALSFPMVNYGSEARGYAGLILCTVMGIYAVERTRKYILALAIGFGLLFHLGMAAAVAALGLAALFDNWQETKSPAETIRKTTILFLPSFAAFVPIALILTSGIMYSHGYHFGYINPFDIDHFVTGFGGMMNAMAGLSSRAGLLLGFAVVSVAVFVTMSWKNEQPIRPVIYFCFLVVLPVAVIAFRTPNSGIPRYYLSSAAALLLCVTDLISQAWRKNLHAIVILGLTIFTVAQIADIMRFIDLGRGQYETIVALMTSKGASTYASVKEPWPARIQLDYYAKQKGLDLRYVPEKDACTNVADWLAIETSLIESDQPPQAIWGQGACAHRYGDAKVFEGWGLSGRRLTLYRRLQ